MTLVTKQIVNACQERRAVLGIYFTVAVGAVFNTYTLVTR